MGLTPGAVGAMKEEEIESLINQEFKMHRSDFRDLFKTNHEDKYYAGILAELDGISNAIYHYSSIPKFDRIKIPMLGLIGKMKRYIERRDDISVDPKFIPIHSVIRKNDFITLLGLPSDRIGLTVTIEPVGLKGMIDRDKMQRVIINIVKNAKEAIEKMQD